MIAGRAGVVVDVVVGNQIFDPAEHVASKVYPDAATALRFQNLRPRRATEGATFGLA